jgi:hypothetical protein
MFEASIEFLNDKHIDLISSYLIATPERLAVMDFTYPVAISDHVIVQPMPKIQKDLLTASVKPLQPTVNQIFHEHLIQLAFIVTIFFLMIWVVFQLTSLKKKTSELHFSLINCRISHSWRTRPLLASVTSS